jgi:Flp pilus assembly CpaE family ATPase
MKVSQPYTVLDASLNLHRLDSALWHSLIWKHSSGLDVLQSPGSARFGEQLRDERVRHLLRLAQGRIPGLSSIWAGLVNYPST